MRVGNIKMRDDSIRSECRQWLRCCSIHLDDEMIFSVCVYVSSKIVNWLDRFFFHLPTSFSGVIHEFSTFHCIRGNFTLFSQSNFSHFIIVSFALLLFSVDFDKNTIFVCFCLENLPSIFSCFFFPLFYFLMDLRLNLKISSNLRLHWKKKHFSRLSSIHFAFQITNHLRNARAHFYPTHSI